MQACLNNVSLQNDRLRFSVTRLWEHRHAGVPLRCHCWLRMRHEARSDNVLYPKALAEAPTKQHEHDANEKRVTSCSGDGQNSIA